VPLAVDIDARSVYMGGRSLFGDFRRDRELSTSPGRIHPIPARRATTAAPNGPRCLHPPSPPRHSKSRGSSQRGPFRREIKFAPAIDRLGPDAPPWALDDPLHDREPKRPFEILSRCNLGTQPNSHRHIACLTRRHCRARRNAALAIDLAIDPISTTVFRAHARVLEGIVDVGWTKTCLYADRPTGVSRRRNAMERPAWPAGRASSQNRSMMAAGCNLSLAHLLRPSPRTPSFVTRWPSARCCPPS